MARSRFRNCILIAAISAIRTRSPSKILLWSLALFLIIPPVSSFASELHDAVRANDSVRLEQLIELRLGTDDAERAGPLLERCLGQARRLESLALIDTSNGTDFVLGTPLHLATSQGNAELVRTLIKLGADVEAPSERRDARALHLAAEFGEVNVAKALLEGGAEPDAPDGFNRTPLHRAASKGRLEVVLLLIEAGADIGATDTTYQSTPLHDAAHEGRFEVVKFLVEAGADIQAKDHAGRTPLTHAAFPQSYTIVGDGRLLEYLVEKGADPNVKDKFGQTPLGYAKMQAGNGDVVFAKIVEELRRIGAVQ